MKIGIYGGSFNPVHYGHVGMVKWILEHTDLDKVWLFVSPKSPHKTDREDLDANYPERVDAVREAMKDIPRVLVSDFENHLPRPSYTANTLRALEKARPDDEFTLIIGEDNWNVFDKWREWEYILQNYRVFVYPRKENTDRGKAAQSRKTAALKVESIKTADVVRSEAKNVVFLREAPYFDISSTEIREKMQKDLQV